MPEPLAGKERDAVLAGIFGGSCEMCDHPIGEHAALRDNDTGKWPCLVEGCNCEGLDE